MKQFVALLLFALSACAAPTHHGGAAPAPAAPEPIDQLDWFQGTWRMPMDGGFVEEHWSAVEGRGMLGTNRTVEGGRMIAYEFLILEQRGSKVVYTAFPGGSSPGVEFTLTSLTPTEVMFENPEHDFPTWIRYQRKGTDGLNASIGGEASTIEFEFVRAP